MTKPSNVEVIVERMLNYMSTTTDPHSKSETSTRIAELAERYAPDNSWFIEVMNNVFRLGGDAVDPVLGSNIMRIIAEGAGDDDEQVRLASSLN
jgi:AP-4 complex subunit epsilon-1